MMNRERELRADFAFFLENTITDLFEVHQCLEDGKTVKADNLLWETGVKIRQQKELYEGESDNEGI